MKIRLLYLLSTLIAGCALVQTAGSRLQEAGAPSGADTAGRAALPPLTSVSMGGTTTSGGGGTLPARAAAPRLLASYGSLPLAFEQNQGQTTAGVQYLTRGKGYSLFLTATGADLLLRRGNGESARSRIARRRQDLRVRGARVGQSGAAPTRLRFRFAGAAAHPKAESQEPLPGVVNYLIGNDPHKWRTGIATYGRVRYQNVYPDIDLCYYGSQGRLEYDWVVAPGGSVRKIGMDIEGARSVRLTAGGDLRIAVGGGEVIEQAPVVYQEAHGLRRPIAARWVVRADAHTPGVRVGFDVAKYDRSRPLIIDPILYFSTYLGGSQFATATGIAVDSFACAYITGYTNAADFPTQSPIQAANHANTSSGHDNAFVAKLNATGTALVYSTYLGGSTEDDGYGIAVDSQGEAYVTGLTESKDFPVMNALYGTLPGTSGAAFVTKLNAAGNGLIYSTYLGGSNGAEATAIAVDGQGNAYVTGGTGSTNFPVTASAFQNINRGNGVLGDGNAFITKINPTGSALVYSTYLGGTQGDTANAIAVDSSGEAYVTGDTNSSDFPLAGADQKMPLGEGDAFVTKLNANGNALIFSTYLGGSLIDHSHAIAVDGNGSVYVTGDTNSTDFPILNPYQSRNRNIGGVSTGFVTKYNSLGVMIYSTYLGGSGDSIGNGESGDGIVVDSLGDAFVTGSSSSPDFPTVNPIQVTNGGGNAFLTEINPTGSALLFSTFLGGTGGDAGLGIALDILANPYIAGETRSTNFPVTPDAFQSTNHSTDNANAFVARIQMHAAVGDFNGDCRPDLLFQNQTSGALSLWHMNGSAFLNGVSIPIGPGSGYKAVGVGDFNGDGKPDILFQNQTTNQLAIWYMIDTAFQGGVLAPVIPATGYKVVGVGDFNGDGKPDIVFQNQSTGQVAIWFMNGSTFAGGVALPTLPGAAWQVVGVGDFNGDGQSDLVFQNANSGDLAIWFLNGVNYIGGASIPYVPGPGYHVVAVADYNGDTHPDLVFQNTTTGQLAVWFFVGTTLTGGTSVPTVPVTGWSVVGPH